MSFEPLLEGLDAVLFDLDGTLADTAPDLVAALNRICAEEDMPPPPYQLAASNVSNGAIGLTRLAFPRHTAADQQELCARLVAVYEANLCVNTETYPGMREALAELTRQGLRWGVVTNKLHRLAVPIIEQLGLADHCAVVVGGDTAARNKPAPDPILHALNELNLAPESVAYVGDHLKDMQAGSEAGVRTVAVTWGYREATDDPYAWGADYTIEAPLQLVNVHLEEKL